MLQATEGIEPFILGIGNSPDAQAVQLHGAVNKVSRIQWRDMEATAA